MIKPLIAAASSFVLMVLPQTAIAQDAAETPATQTEPEAPVKKPQTFPPVNFNMDEDPENILVLDLSNGERVSIRLMPQWAPDHVERIKQLTAQGFYNNVIFHRVIEGFMAQAGDPTGTGQGGSDLPDLNEEFNPMPHVRGTISMARTADENSANSQFFIVFYPRFSLDNTYTNFGRVISNMAAVDAINRGEPPTDPTRIVLASLASENKAKPAPVVAPKINSEITLDDLSAPIAQ